MKFRKKPVVIEAFQLEQSYLNWPDWANDALTENVITTTNMGRLTFGTDYCAKIKTLEGEMIARPGDFIIQGVSGEIYPCKSDIFEKTYEAVKEK